MVWALPMPPCLGALHMRDARCDGNPCADARRVPTVAMAMSAVLRVCGAYKARAVDRRIGQTNPTVDMAMSAVTRECGAGMARAVTKRIRQMMWRAFERRVNDEDICIPSGRQAMMARKCCRYTVKRRYFDEWVIRCNILHADLAFLARMYCQQIENFVWPEWMPELVVCMHLFNALDLQFPRQWHDSKSLELGRESGIMFFQRMMACYR